MMNCELMLTYDTPHICSICRKSNPPYICSMCIKTNPPAYMFNVYKNQLSRQTGSRNLTGPKTLPTIWHTYMKLVTKYQSSAINSCWENCDEKYPGTDKRTDGRMDGQTDGRTDRVKTVYHPAVERGYNKQYIGIRRLDDSQTK